MRSVTPWLWFDNQAEEAANFYVSIIEDSKILDVVRNGDHAFSVTFELKGRQFHAMNGGPMFKLSEAFSLFVDCEDQAEVDGLWEKLLADGGEPSRCGWIKDRFGVSWQIIPSKLGELLRGPNPDGAGRAMNAMMQMSKIIVADLQAAYDG